MINENPTLTFLTFLTAIIGYTGMTLVIILSFKNQLPVILWRTVSAIILLHVIMVWNFRYEWQFSLAVRNGYAGFLIFHSALIMILITTLVKQKFSLLLVRVSFIVVSIGAVGAVFRYGPVEVYRIPVIVLGIIGFSSLTFNFLSSKRLNS